MISKFINKNVFRLVSFLLAFLGLILFFVYKSPFYSAYVIPDLSKNITLLSLTCLALLFYIISIIKNKNVSVINSKKTKLLFILLPIFILLSVLFSGEIKNAFFGKYIFSQSGLTYLAIIILVYINVIYLKSFKALSWFLLFLSSIFVTIPTILALIVSKFGLTTLSSKLVYFVDSWDTVALVSGIIIIIALIYYEVIAKSNTQKWVSGVLVGLHTILIACILLPDIWYALLFSSLLIFIINRNNKPFYHKLSFYVGAISLLFSLMFAFSGNSLVNKVSTQYASFANKYSGVNYTYVKPRIGLSLELALTQLKQGRIFGSGPNEFYKVWQKDKPQSVINSNYWSTDFSNSYSTLTTFLVTVGILGTGLIILILVSLILSLKNKIKSVQSDENYRFNEENKFYLYATSGLFVFSILAFIFFTNVANAVILLAIASAFSLAEISNYKDVKNRKSYILLFLIFLLILIFSTRVVIRKAKAVKLTNLAINQYQKNNNLNNLESNILKAVNFDKSDINYRLLTNFYLLKTQNTLGVLNASSSQSQISDVQSKATESIQKAAQAANTAIKIDENDYNNYLNLGAVYAFLMNTNSENKETNYNLAKASYNQAINLYPKNPATYLTLAQLDYEYNKDLNSTKSNLDKSLQVKPNYSQAFYIYSQLASESNDRDQALKYALRAIQSNPANVDAYLQYGILTLNNPKLTNDDLNNAYLAFSTTLQLDPNNLLAGYYLGITYILAGQYDKAQSVIEILEKALPDNQQVANLKNFLDTNKANSKNNTQTNSEETKANSNSKK